MSIIIDDETLDKIKNLSILEVEGVAGPSYIARVNHRYPKPVDLVEALEFFTARDGLRAGRIFFADDTFLVFHRGQKASYVDKNRYECENEFSVSTTANGLKTLLGHL